MSTIGQRNRRVTFRRRELDANGVRLGAWVDIVTRDARVQPKVGGEAVLAQRLEGRQPVIITVEREALTKGIDNSYQAVDYRDPTIVWDVASAILTEDQKDVEVLAIQRLGGDE